jgi:hypothetical protein
MESLHPMFWTSPKRSEARLILSTQRKRCSKKRTTPTEWSQVGRERISHSFVGGVTERVVDLSIYQPTGVIAPPLGPALKQAIPRDASTTLSLGEHAKLFRPIPTPQLVEPLACVNLGSREKPVYHTAFWEPLAATAHLWLLFRPPTIGVVYH